MNKRFTVAKLMPVWIAISAALIIAGIVLYALLGFNAAAASYKTVEVTYSPVVSINQKEEALETICEDAFSSNSLGYTDKSSVKELSSSYFSETGDTRLVYQFSSDASDSAIDSAISSIKASLEKDETYSDVYVGRHIVSGEKFYEGAWRGAIAIAVGAVVVLIYMIFRFGMAATLTGLIACAHDALLTLALLAVLRIPAVGAMSVLYAAFAAFLSLLLWLVQCVKMRETFKDPAFASYTAEEAVAESYRTSKKTGLIVSAVLIVVLALIGAVTTPGARAFLLPAILPVAVCTYSSLVLAPSVYVPLKAKFDRIKSKHKRYEGKQKTEKAEEQA